MVKLISQDRVAAADGWFYHIRQMEPMCLPMWAHWRHVANMIELTGPEKKVIIHADKRPAGTHARVFNAPTTDEVGIIVVDEQHERRDIILETRGNSLQRIAETHRSYDALQYPLIFWAGWTRWLYHFEYKMTNGRKVTCMRFCAYYLMVRDNNSILLKYRQLVHEFVVDMWAKTECERLLYIRHNQKQLRVENYAHL